MLMTGSQPWQIVGRANALARFHEQKAKTLTYSIFTRVY